MIEKLNQLIKVSSTNPFYQKWDGLLNTVSHAFNLTDDEKMKVGKTKIAQLVAAIPYLAGCEDAERTAVTHLGTYLLTIRTNQIYDHKPSDDVDLLRRFKMIDNFIGGDSKIINRGLNLIALNMICDYQRDIEDDKKIGKYNPIAAGNLNFEKRREELVKQINSVESKYMDEILNPKEAEEEWWLAEE